jgi:hypothetical protein
MPPTPVVAANRLVCCDVALDGWRGSERNERATKPKFLLIIDGVRHFQSECPLRLSHSLDGASTRRIVDGWGEGQLGEPPAIVSRRSEEALSDISRVAGRSRATWRAIVLEPTMR